MSWRATPRLGSTLLAAGLLWTASNEARAQSHPSFFPERYVACREPRAERSAPRPPAAEAGLVSLPRRRAPSPLAMAPLVVIDVAVAEPVPTRPRKEGTPEVEPPVLVAADQDWRCVGFTRGKAGILRVLRAPPGTRFAGHADAQGFRLDNARAASAADFREAIPSLRRLLERPVSDDRDLAVFEALDARLNGARALSELGDTASAPRVAAPLVRREDRAYSLLWTASFPPLEQLDPAVAEAYAADVIGRVVAGRTPAEPEAAGDETLLRAALPRLVTPDAARLALVGRLPGSDTRCDVLAARIRLGDVVLRDALRAELDRDLRTQRAVACYSDLMPEAFPGRDPVEVEALLLRHRLAATLALLERDRQRSRPDPAWDRARARLRAVLTERSADPDVAGGPQDRRYQPMKRALHLVALAELGDPAARAAAMQLIVDDDDEGVAPWLAAEQALRFDWPGAADAAAHRLAWARHGRTRRYDTDLDPERGFVRVNDHVRVVDALAKRRDPRFALGLLDQERNVREATFVHLARLPLPAVCDVVIGSAAEATEQAVQDAFWALTRLGEACGEQAYQLASDGGAAPHARGMALELAAMMRDARVAPLLRDRGRGDDVRPARARARIIYAARE